MSILHEVWGDWDTFHAVRKALHKSSLHVFRRDPLAENTSHTVTRERNGISLVLRTYYSLALNSRHVSRVCPTQPTETRANIFLHSTGSNETTVSLQSKKNGLAGLLSLVSRCVGRKTESILRFNNHSLLTCINYSSAYNVSSTKIASLKRVIVANAVSSINASNAVRLRL